MVGRCRGGEWRTVSGTRPWMDQEADAKGQHNQHFKAAQKCSDAGRELDAMVSERPDESRRRQGQGPPWNVHMELHLKHVREQVAKESCASSGSENLIDQVAPRGHETAAAAQSTGSEGV